MVRARYATVKYKFGVSRVEYEFSRPSDIFGILYFRTRSHEETQQYSGTGKFI